MTKLLAAAEALIAAIQEDHQPIVKPLRALRAAVAEAKKEPTDSQILDWLATLERPYYIDGYGWAQPDEFRIACRAAMAADGSDKR